MIVRVAKHMNFCLLPLSQHHKDMLKEKLLSNWNSWYEEWIPKNDQDRVVNIELTQLDNKNLGKWFGRAHVSWYSTVDKGSYSVGIAHDDSYRKNLINQMTGCQETDFSQGLIDASLLMNKLSEVFISQLVNTELSFVDDKSITLQSMQSVSKLNANFAGWVVEVKHQQNSNYLLLPNQVIKAMLFTASTQKANNLKTREFAIGEKQIPITFNIEGLTINLQDLRTLQVGDVLTTHKKSHEQIKMRVANTLLDDISIKLGKKQTQKAVQFD